MQAHFFMFLQHFSASTRLKKSGPACESAHGKQDSGSKSFEVVSWPQLGPYENNSIHPLLPQGLCKPISSCFCNTSVPAQDSRNRAQLARVDMASKTQDQSLLKLYHGPQLGPYENNSIHPLLLQGLCKPISSCFCNTSVPAQDSRNRTPLARVDMASKTQDQSLLKLYHGRSSDLMRIIQFILSCPKDYASPFPHVSATLQCQHKTQEIGPRLRECTWQARLRIKVF